jgi:DNA repair protein RadC
MDSAALKRRLMGGGGRRSASTRGATRRNELLSSPRLSDQELVEGLRSVAGLSKQTATAIAAAFPAGQGLEHTSEAVLQELGATKGQAAKVKAAFSFVRMCDAGCRKRGRTVRRPDEAASAAMEAITRAIGNRDQEYFVVVLLDARQQVIDIFGVAVGSLSEVAVHPRELFKHAIEARAHSIIIAHNHPSGTAEPSEADVQLTQRMMEVGRTMGIPVLDSLVTTADGDWSSLQAMGLL